MAVTHSPSRLRATAVFNPAAAVPGFLVPLFPGSGGDNQTYVQRFTQPERLLEFTAVTWPDEGVVAIEPTTFVHAGRESLWGFAFPGEEPLVLPWGRFRQEMKERIDDPCFKSRPGLLFDVVDGLDLEDEKERVFLAAFNAYAKHGRRAAEQWRDRSILEPALQAAIDQIGNPAGSGVSQLTARLAEGMLTIDLRQENSEKLRDDLMRAYHRLAKQHPELFHRFAGMVVNGAVPQSERASRERTTTVAVYGRLAEREIDRGYWHNRGIEVVKASELSKYPKRKRERRQVVYLSSLPDWTERPPAVVHADNAVAVLMTTAAAPLVSEADMRLTSPVPTIVAFSPYGTSQFGGDPIASVSRLIATLAECWEQGGTLVPADHNSLVRESKPISTDVAGTACTLLGRALRVQAVTNSHARLVLDYRMSSRQMSELTEALGSAIKLLPPHVIGEGVVKGRAIPMLLAERPTRVNGRGNLQYGVRKLLEIRGWQVSDGPNGLRARDQTHDFPVMVARHNDAPKSHHVSGHPSFGRASMLVVHESPRREWLLAGNLGEFFHVNLEDIALMIPGTKWVWPILRKQLRGAAARRSKTALKLYATLAIEAFKAQRYQESIMGLDIDRALQLLSASDCLDRVRLSSEYASEDGVQLILSGLRSEIEPYLTIRILDDGPFVEID